MPRKKKVEVTPQNEPAEPHVSPGELEEPFHQGECDRCTSYHRARYIPGQEDLANALRGERVHMGLCRRKRRFLVTATAEPCESFVQDPAAKPRSARVVQRDGGGEYVVR